MSETDLGSPALWSKNGVCFLRKLSMREGEGERESTLSVYMKALVKAYRGMYHSLMLGSCIEEKVPPSSTSTRL